MLPAGTEGSEVQVVPLRRSTTPEPHATALPGAGQSTSENDDMLVLICACVIEPSYRDSAPPLPARYHSESEARQMAVRPADFCANGTSVNVPLLVYGSRHALPS